MNSLQATPGQLGFRMPAEWHPHSATWLSWPKDPETWPDRLEQVQTIYLQMIAALAPHEVVNILVDNEETQLELLTRCNLTGVSNVRFHQLQTVDAWIRDYGPNFLIDDHGLLAYNDWRFNAWGDKYDQLKKDDRIPSLLQPLLNARRFEPGIILEGGSIEVNGAGCVLTTEQCLLNPNRNPDLSRKEIENYLRNYLNVQKVLWLSQGIEGDDTDGHVDDIARFVSPNLIVCAIEEDKADANYEPLQDNIARLRSMCDVAGRPFKIATIPMPGVVEGSSTEKRDLHRLPASYANFYIANNVVLLPTFGHANDSRATETLQQLFSTRRVVPIDCEPLVWGMGTIHCLTQQQPAP
ncbi:MAG: agmatine/peptidylarginine deiminase [Pyrinomonadaceae bacterium]